MIAMRPSGGLKFRMRRMASIPVMPGSTISISTASNSPSAIRSVAASPRPMNSA